MNLRESFNNIYSYDVTPIATKLFLVNQSISSTKYCIERHASETIDLQYNYNQIVCSIQKQSRTSALEQQMVDGRGILLKKKNMVNCVFLNALLYLS